MASHDSILLRPGAASVDIHSVLITNRVGSIYILLFGSFVCFSMFLPVHLLLLEVSAQNGVRQWLTHRLAMCVKVVTGSLIDVQLNCLGL